jgi:hypothetical protein
MCNFSVNLKNYFTLHPSEIWPDSKEIANFERCYLHHFKGFLCQKTLFSLLKKIKKLGMQ